MIKIDKSRSERISQGDIIQDVEFIEYAIEKEGVVEISKIKFPYVIVLTQDCDLEQDYKNRTDSNSSNQDKHLISVIVAPLYNIEHVFDGKHLSELGLQMQSISKNPKKTDHNNLKKNNNPRYHFLEFDESIKIVDSVIDFKHYFTVNASYLKESKKNNFVGKVDALYREDISQRFASFLSRIGLPEVINNEQN